MLYIWSHHVCGTTFRLEKCLLFGNELPIIKWFKGVLEDNLSERVWYFWVFDFERLKTLFSREAFLEIGKIRTYRPVCKELQILFYGPVKLINFWHSRVKG